MKTNQKKETQQTEETQEEIQQDTGFKVLSKKQFYNETVTILHIVTEITPRKAKVILDTKEYGDISCTLKKQVIKESQNQETGMLNRVLISEPINETNIKEVLPELVCKIAKVIQNKKSAKCNISFAKTEALVNGEQQTYLQMFPNDLESIYCEEIHKTDESNIDKQILRRDRNKKNL